MGNRLQSAAALLLGQLGLAGMSLGLVGLIVFWRRSRLNLLMAWTAGASIAFAVLYGSADSYVYLIPALLCLAVWIGTGLNEIIAQIPPRPGWLQLSLGLAALAYFAIQPIARASQVDASHDVRAESFGREILSSVPQDAIIFARGDEAVFTLWYFHFALHERPDVMVLAEDLLHFDWYQESLRATYPSLVLPGPFPWPETIMYDNPSRTACYARYAEGTKIDCLPSPNSPPSE